MRLNELKSPLAITMWDSSWLRRRYAGGGFESFDTAVDELVERGYNAVRLDVFPHMIANAPDGSNSERFLDPTGASHQSLDLHNGAALGQFTFILEETLLIF